MEQRKKELLRVVNTPGTFAVNNGILCTDVGEDWAEVELQAGEDCLNPIGIVHGGCILTMMDQATGFLANSREISSLTLSCQARFLRPTQPGLVKARSRVIHWGEDQILLQVEVRDRTGEVTAEGTYIYQRMKRASSEKA